MNNLNPTIELEQQLGSQIYTALQGGVVEKVLRKTIINGYSLKIAFSPITL